ncbi:MAG: 23S rRNA (adenine(2503)-C(2))-methyltransferase RlmN [Rikenellaceae bacterium]
MNQLFGSTLNEIQQIVTGLGMPKFTAKQITEWLYKKGVKDFDQMTNISAKNRETLKQNFNFGLIPFIKESISKDGTKKYLFPTLKDWAIESAYIPDKERATLCVSSQAGCRMGCEFCMTGKQGLQHNLTSGEILNQIAMLPEREKLTNLVYMGMGEPMDNLDEVMRSLEILTSPWGYGWSPSRITLSTCGMIKPLKVFLDNTSVHLAVSLHNPFGEQRRKIMPVEASNPISEVVELLKKYDFSHQRRVSFEYILLENINDSKEHIKELCRLLNGLKCRINIIRFHRIPGSEFYSPELDRIIKFRDALTSKGIMTTLRSSRGEDIGAACGLLSTKEKEGGTKIEKN